MNQQKHFITHCKKFDLGMFYIWIQRNIKQSYLNHKDEVWCTSNKNMLLYCRFMIRRPITCYIFVWIFSTQKKISLSLFVHGLALNLLLMFLHTNNIPVLYL